jgi:hypothetical protein
LKKGACDVERETEHPGYLGRRHRHQQPALLQRRSADITSNTYYDWFIHRDYFVFYATAMATKFLETFKEFPPRHPPASFSIDQAVEKLHEFLAKD